MATFRATYLPELVRINPETLMQSREILGSTYGVREGVEMSCTDVSTMVAAMGEYVRYGFPFPFQIENGYVKCAAPVGGLPEKPIRLHVRTGLPSLELLKLDASK